MIQKTPPESSLLKRQPITVLLVDDQPMIGEAVRRMLADESDIDIHFCSDPSEAVPMAEQISPTVILQDLVMPDIDGLTLVRYYRANPATRDIPIIVLSVKEEPTVKADSFATGANDYLVKLPDRIELIARIRYHSNAYINLLQRNEAYLALEKSQQQLAEELERAADYVRSMLPEPMDGDIKTEWRFVPSMELGGDTFGYHWLDQSHFAFYLLDVCGHGVGAALLSVAVLNALRSNALPDTNFMDPCEVLNALNKTFPMDKHNGQFFTIWYGVFNKNTRQLIYSSGGHPPAIMMTGKKEEEANVRLLGTGGLIVGITEQYNYKYEVCNVDDFCQIYVYSDGVYEVSDTQGKMWNFEQFVEFMTQDMNNNSSLDGIFNHVKQRHGSEYLDDDFSILKVVF